MAEDLTFGEDSACRFRLSWETAPPHDCAATATRGRLALFLGGRLVWGHETPDGVRGVDWTWVELLEHMTDVWRFIEWEETDPIGLGRSPRVLRALAEDRWQDLPEADRDKEEAHLWDFERCHNLAAGLEGIWLPALWVLRQGLHCIVATDVGEIRTRLDRVLDALTDLGDAIASRLRNVPEDRAQAALQAWATRRTVPAEDFVEAATGLPPDVLREVAADSDFGSFWDVQPARAPNEVLAAARMTGTALSPAQIRQVVSIVKKMRKVETPELNDLSAQAEEALIEGRQYDQGHALANWLRRRLQLATHEKLIPEALLRTWNVDVTEVALDAEQLDAVCCWGPKHGPAIVLNTRGRHAHAKPGRRATLAHEVCHLLVDRFGALPLGEALGGRVPADVEARARAFAAELLLPRSIAAEATRRAANAEEALKDLRASYGVSAELAAWQIINSGAELDAEDLYYLRPRLSAPPPRVGYWRDDRNPRRSGKRRRAR